MTMDFEPQFVDPGGEAQPAAPDMSSPQWVLDTWRKLYFNYPSPGLKKRVKETERWVNDLG